MRTRVAASNRPETMVLPSFTADKRVPTTAATMTAVRAVYPRTIRTPHSHGIDQGGGCLRLDGVLSWWILPNLVAFHGAEVTGCSSVVKLPNCLLVGAMNPTRRYFLFRKLRRTKGLTLIAFFAKSWIVMA